MFLVPFFAMGQVHYQKTLEGTIQFSIGERNSAFFINDFNYTKDKGGEQYIRAVSISEGNLMITLQLPELIAHEYYEVSFNVTIDGRTFYVRPESLSRHVIYGLEKGERFDIQWFDAFEEVPLNVRSMDLKVSARFHSENCRFDFEPLFTWKKQKPHFVFAATGFAIIGIAEFVFARQAEVEYDKYVGQIVGIAPDEQEHDIGPNGFHDADDHFNEVKSKESTAKIISLTGKVIVAGSALTYLIRHVNFHRDHKKWEKYCKGTTSLIGLRPVFDATVPGQSVGLALSVRF